MPSFLTKPVLGIIGAALLLAAFYGLWARGSHYLNQRDAAIEQRDRAQAELTLARTDAALKETAAVERQADGAELTEQAKELADARTHPDVDTRRQRRLCVILRQQRGERADIPECRGLDRAAGTTATD